MSSYRNSSSGALIAAPHQLKHAELQILFVIVGAIGTALNLLSMDVLDMDSQSHPGSFSSVVALDEPLNGIPEDWMDGMDSFCDGRIETDSQIILEVSVLYIDALGKLTELNSLYLS
jgi:hypothetical protein